MKMSRVRLLHPALHIEKEIDMLNKIFKRRENAPEENYVVTHVAGPHDLPLKRRWENFKPIKKTSGKVPRTNREKMRYR